MKFITYMIIIRYHIPLNIILGIVGLCFCMLGVPDTVYGYTGSYFTEDFESYADGTNIDNVGEWNNVDSPPTLKTQNDNVYSGTYSASSTSPNTNISYHSKTNINASSTYARVMMKFAKNITPGASTYYGGITFNGVGDPTNNIVQIVQKGNKLQTGTVHAENIFIDSIDYDHWYDIDIFVNCTAGTWKVKVDGGDWSSNIADYGSCVALGVGTMNFTSGNAVGIWYYYDEIYAGPWEYDPIVFTGGYIDPDLEQSLWEKSGGYDYLTMNKTLKCFLDTPCDWDFSYSNEAFGGTFYLLPYSAGMLPILDPSLTATSSYAVNNRGYLRQGKFTLQSSAETAETEYCVYWQASPTGVSSSDRIYCGYFAEFLLDDAIADLLAQYNCETICSDIATSTDWTGGFWYGLECGARKVACWAFVPSTASVQSFSSVIQKYNDVFPFSIVNETKEILLTSTTTASANITLDGFFPGDNSSIVVLDNQTISSKLGTVWATIRGTLDYVIYFLCFLYFIQYFLRSKQSEETA